MKHFAIYLEPYVKLFTEQAFKGEEENKARNSNLLTVLLFPFLFVLLLAFVIWGKLISFYREVPPASNVIIFGKEELDDIDLWAFVACSDALFILRDIISIFTSRIKILSGKTLCSLFFVHRTSCWGVFFLPHFLGFGGGVRVKSEQN